MNLHGAAMTHWLKVLLLMATIGVTAKAEAFGVLRCSGNALVVLLSKDGEKIASRNGFKVEHGEAAALRFVEFENVVGDLFPWGAAIWKPKAKQASFEKIEFKTDDETYFDLSYVSKVTKNSYKIRCEYSID
jgi:hypothetical protein